MKSDHPTELDRRNLLKSAVATSVGALGSAVSAQAAPVPAKPRGTDLIARENGKPGTRDWQLTYVRLDRPDGYRSRGIEGYCSHQSIEPGQTIQVMVSVDPPGHYSIDIFRMGYYGGAGARLMTTLGPFAGKPQPLPDVGPRRLRECRWEVAAELPIPNDWPSGVYLGRLSREPAADGTHPWQSYIVFIVRDPPGARPAQIVFQCSDNTWQAYNRWPTRFSLYDDGSAKDWTSLPGIDVSFDRPYGKYRQIYENPQSVGSGEFLLWEYPLCFWLEQHGYDVTYCSNSDLLTPDAAAGAKALISVGHDEYWDLRQYESVQRLVDSGTSVLFLSGNTICWVSPLSTASDGRPNRILTRAAPYGGLVMGPGSKVREHFDSVGPDE
ncbi:MAG TPA: N,N-dimethylformamidase beta subunit family domain-containing protein, partial [Pirellulales bacterium]|nr:N,N-dimethylformamidase beta subunit family domain-containing protein [Pirellulales bacterium]